MKKTISLLLIIVIVTFFYPDKVFAVAPTDYVSCFNYNEASAGVGAVTRIDSNTTNSNDLTDNNTTPSATGLVGDAIDPENANTEYLSITDATQSGLGFTGDFSWSMWIKPESQPASTDQMGLVGKWATDDGAYIMTIWNNAGTYRVRTNLYDDGAPSTNVPVNFTTNLGTGVWKHLVWTVDVGATDSVGELWVNGTSVGSGTYTGVNAINLSSGILGIGGGYEGLLWQTSFDGLRDVEEMYNRVLTGAEITQLYNSGAGVDCSGRGVVTTTPIIHMQGDIQLQGDAIIQ